VAFLTDYRSGAIGRISLETPLSRAAMIAATQQVIDVNEETAKEKDEPQKTE